MKLNDWKSIAELVGIFAVVASLVFVALQLKQSQAIALAEMYGAVATVATEETGMVIDNADIWRRGNANEHLTPTEAIIYAQLIRSINDRFWFRGQQLRELGRVKQADNDLAEFAAFLFENPGARQAWRSREDWLGKYRAMLDPEESFTADWVTHVESAIAVYEEQSSVAP